MHFPKDAVIIHSNTFVVYYDSGFSICTPNSNFAYILLQNSSMYRTIIST